MKYAPFVRSALLSLGLAACGTRVQALSSTDAAVTDAAGSADASDAAREAEAGPSTPLSCERDTWCWQTPLPQGLPLNATYIASATDAWAVGDHGTILRQVDGAWINVRSPTTVDLQYMAGTSATNVWAWGSRRPLRGPSRFVLIRWNGSFWSEIDLPDDVVSFELSAGTEDSVWARLSMSNDSSLRRLNGSLLSIPPALTGAVPPAAICARSANDVWATASRSNGAHPTMLFHWDGAAWTLVYEAAAGSSERFDGTLGCPADNVAVSAYFTFDTGVREQFTMSAGRVDIAPLALPQSTAPTLFQTPHGELYLFNTSTALRWAAQGWQAAYTLDGASTYATRFDVSLDHAAGLMANGTPFLQSLTMAGWRRDASATTASLTTFATGTLESRRDPIAAFGEQIWAYRDGARWLRAATPIVSNGMQLSATDSWGASPEGVWIVGRAGAIARYDHSAHTITAASVDTPTVEDLNDIDGSDASTAWAVGNNATIYRLDGDRWKRHPVPVPQEIDGVTLSNLHLVAVDVKSPMNVMVLGNDVAGGRFASVFFHWNGSAWTSRMSFGATISIFDRDAEDNVYFVDGNLIRRRPLVGEDVTIVSLASDSAQRLQVFGFDDFELHTFDDSGSALQMWEIDPGQLVRAFSATAPTRFNDVIRGADNTLWGLGAFGSIAAFRASP